MAKKGRRKKKTIDINVAVVILVIISVLLFVLIYTKSGYIGEHLSPMHMSLVQVTLEEEL